MKIVHLGDSDAGGGAAHAMIGLHDALRRIGAASHLLVHHGDGRRPDRDAIATRSDDDRLFSVQYRALVRHYVELNRTAESNTHFSLYVDGINVAGHVAVREAAVVHLHWTASFQTPADIGALLDARPVVWTLHDLGPLTGGCHFPAGCQNYSGSCDDCPQLARDPFSITAATLRDKTAQWSGRRMTFIAPSRHMATLAGRSAIVHALEATIAHVPLGIDVAAFRPASKAAARRALGIPVDGHYVMCGSHHNAELRKNLAVVHRVMDAVCAQQSAGPPELTLLTVGEPKLEVPERCGYRIVQLGHVPLAMMPSVYAAADVFLHPSLEDNFPCMLLEASSCGTPAIAFDVGGVSELVLDEVSGHIVPAGDETGMAAELSALLRDPMRLERMGRDARARAVAEFSDLTSARRHLALYDEIAGSEPIASRPRPARTALDAVFPRWAAACLTAEVREERARAASRDTDSAAHIVALDRQLCEKDAEIVAVHQVAAERLQLVEHLHREAEGTLAALDAVRQVAEEREALASALHHAAERARTIAENLQREVAERDASLRQLDRQIQDKEAALGGVHQIAIDRLHVVEALEHAVHERDDALAQLRTTIDDQRSEIDLAHRVASERGHLVEELHRVAQERAARIERLEQRRSLLRRLSFRFRRPWLRRDT